MGWPWIVLLALGVVLVVAAEWPRIDLLVGADARRARARGRRKARLHVVSGGESEPGEGGEREEFARSVQADLDSLPTIDEPTTKR